MKRRQFVHSTAWAVPGLAGLGSALAAGTRELPAPSDIEIEFRWPRLLAHHSELRTVASRRRAEAPEGITREIAAYRDHMGNVRDPRIWLTMESYIAKADSLETLRKQLKLFPLEFTGYHVEPTGTAVADALTSSRPFFDSSIWPTIQERRRSRIQPMLEGQFEPNREKLLNFLFTSLNAERLPLQRLVINLVGRYVLTGADTREIHGRHFTLVETERFSPTGVLESILMMLTRIIEVEDRGNARGALFLLRERQRGLRLPNAALFPRAVAYWTAAEAVRRVVDPEHEHVGETLRIYERALRPFLPALTEVWNPYLDGQLGLDEAITGMIARVA